MSVEWREPSQAIPEIPTRETTHSVLLQKDYVQPEHAWSDEAKIYSRLIQKLCREAKGKRFLQIAFTNGTRMFRIYKKTDPKPGRAKFYVKSYPHLLDEFRKKNPKDEK